MDDHDVGVGCGDDHLGAVSCKLHSHQAVVVECFAALETLIF